MTPEYAMAYAKTMALYGAAEFLYLWMQGPKYMDALKEVSKEPRDIVLYGLLAYACIAYAAHELLLWPMYQGRVDNVPMRVLGLALLGYGIYNFTNKATLGAGFYGLDLMIQDMAWGLVAFGLIAYAFQNFFLGTTSN
jgi:hypothetical protein